MHMTRKASTQDFQFIAGSLAIDFVNTVGNRLGAQREYLTGIAAFRRWAHAAGLGNCATSRLTQKQLSDLVFLREQLYGACRSLLRTGQTKQLAAVIHRYLPAVLPYRTLRKTPQSYEWAWDAPASIAIKGSILLSAAELLTSGNDRKLRVCEDCECGWLFIDRSRSTPRRWCSMTDCGNRAKTRRHYRRVRL
jgi:predicted RNA-binding Zn ribbon-like protein